MIRKLLRSLHIAAILARYRLDDLLVALPPLKAARAVRLIPWGKRRVREQPRGVRLRLALQELGPIYVKFGQILSTRRDLLPPDIADELANLQDAVPPFPGEQARTIIERQLGKPISELFAEFDEKPLASASIAQVHAAQLHEASGTRGGKAVVVKVVRPGIERRIRRDTELLKFLAAIVQRRHPRGESIRPTDIVAEFERVVLNELDMKREGASAAALRRNFEHSKDLYIPEIHWPRTADRVLVMERVSGVPVKNIDELKRRGVDLEKLARRGLRIFYNQVFRDNLFHADLHPGNILVDCTTPDDPSLIALDFGIVTSLTPADLHYIGANFLAIFNRQYRRVAELHVEAGWVPADTRVDEMEGAVRTVCEPNFTRPLEEVSFAEMVVSLFAMAQHFQLTLQPQLIMLQKTLLNVEGMARELYPRLNIWDVAKPELEAIYRERYGIERTVRIIGRELPAWVARAPEIPELVYEYLKRAGRGELVTRVASDDLARLSAELNRHNRRLPGALLATGVLVSASILAAFQVPPLFGEVSIPGVFGGLLGLLIVWRAWRIG